MAEIRVAIAGCAGRMGQMLVREALATPGMVVAGGTEASGSPHLGRTVGAIVGAPELHAPIVADAAMLSDAADVFLDFTVPAASVALAETVAARGKAVLIGTTGLSDADRARIVAAAKNAAVLVSPNTSVGVNLLLALVEQAASRLGPEFDIEIVETHHRHKVDAPSGTALALGEAASRGRGVKLADVAVRSRDGHTGARVRGAIGLAVLRGGSVAGDHTVAFLGEAERIELTHRAESRRIFAQGAIRAALWLAGRKPGLYGMKDVLGL